jgi:hypothetical protein
MRRSILTTLGLTGWLLLVGTAALHAQQPVDPYPALSRGAVDLAALTAANIADTIDLYLVEVRDFGGVQYGFTLEKGESAQWAYIFYSPSRDSIYSVTIAGQNNAVFGTLSAWSVPSPGAAPAALDTSGTFSQSAKLAELVRADAEYQSFVAAHPDQAARMSVGLLSAAALTGYTPPPGFPVDESAWVLATSSYGDSLHICMLATRTGTLVCDEYFDLSMPYSLGISSVSGVRFGVSSWGIFGMDMTGQQPAASFEAPEGSNNTYIFGAGLWFGARKRINDALAPRVFLTYEPNSGSSWATPGNGYDPRTSYSAPLLANARSHDPVTGAPTNGGGFSWPLWVVSPDTGASMMDPGTYVGLNTNRVASGSTLRPAFVASVVDQYVARYHDSVVANYVGNTETEGFPLGLQFQENIFAEPGGLDHTVIVSYEVVNRSDDTLYDAVVGMVTDFDIGLKSDNDRSRFYSQRPDLRTAIAYTGTEAARPTPFGVLAMTMLEAPVGVEGRGIDESARAQFRTQGEVGTYQSWTITSDPSGSAARYSFMSSGDKDENLPAGDQRGLLASETFTMLPGDTAHFAVAYIVNRGLASTSGADPVLEERITNVINAYYGLQFSGIRASEHRDGALSIAASPNPARDGVSLRLEVPKSDVASLEIYDQLGARVSVMDLGLLAGGTSFHRLDLSGLAPGAYVIVVRTAEMRTTAPLLITR